MVDFYLPVPVDGTLSRTEPNRNRSGKMPYFSSSLDSICAGYLNDEVLQTDECKTVIGDCIIGNRTIHRNARTIGQGNIPTCISAYHFSCVHFFLFFTANTQLSTGEISITACLER